MPQEETQNLYHLMLDLPVEITSPDHYRLLGLAPFEDDEQAIRSAAIDQNAELLKWQNSKYHQDVDRILGEVVTARDLLISPKQKAACDRKLRQELGLPDASPETDADFHLRGINQQFEKAIALVCRELLGIGERVKEAMFLLLDEGLRKNNGGRHDRAGPDGGPRRRQDRHGRRRRARPRHDRAPGRR